MDTNAINRELMDTIADAERAVVEEHYSPTELVRQCGRIAGLKEAVKILESHE